MGILDFFKAPKEDRTQIETRMRYGESSLLTPFENERHVTEDEAMQADEAFNVLETYLKAYLVKAEPIVDDVDDGSAYAGVEPNSGDPLDF